MTSDASSVQVSNAELAHTVTLLSRRLRADLEPALPRDLAGDSMLMVAVSSMVIQTGRAFYQQELERLAPGVRTELVICTDEHGQPFDLQLHARLGALNVQLGVMRALLDTLLQDADDARAGLRRPWARWLRDTRTHAAARERTGLSPEDAYLLFLPDLRERTHRQFRLNGAPITARAAFCALTLTTDGHGQAYEEGRARLEKRYPGMNFRPADRGSERPWWESNAVHNTKKGN